MRYLIAAEADRIQDLIFRSSRLREVVGGSQLLSRFCQDMPALLGVPKGVCPPLRSSAGRGLQSRHRWDAQRGQTSRV
jgi:hypothetical protein